LRIGETGVVAIGTVRATTYRVTPEELRARTTAFAVQIVRICRELREKAEARHIADQLSRSGTAIAANYRSATRARSKREFISRLAIAVEEADETLGWLSLVVDADVHNSPAIADAIKENRELLAILSASRKTAERSRRPEP
jgi:four helix bundle protein